MTIFTQWNSVVFKYGGEVNKIIGDSILAIFADSNKCMEAAIEIRLALSAINKVRISENKTPIRIWYGNFIWEVLFANFWIFRRIRPYNRWGYS